MLKGTTSARLVGLFFIGWALLHFPLLMLWDKPITLLGIPLLPAGIFLLWSSLIAVLAGLMEKHEH